MAQTPNNSNAADRLQGRQVELILRQLDSLPTLPVIATRLLQLTASKHADHDQIVALIQADQSLSAKLLSLAGRASTGMRAEARTVEKAVLMLGLDAVRSAVLSIKVFEMFSPAPKAQTPMDLREFWKHCLAVAAATQLIAQKTPLGVEPSEAFVCGLLHDLGKVALAHCLPKSFGRVVNAADAQFGNIADFERRVIGLDHTLVGRRLAQIWKLPPNIEHTLWLHHQPIPAIPEILPARALIGAVHLADTICREQRFGYSGNYTFPRSAEELAKELRLAPAALQAVRDALPGEIEQAGKLLGLGETTSEQLYRDALGEANRELARLNQRLSQHAARVSAQAKAFEMVQSFSVELEADISLHDLCRKIALAWSTAAEVNLDAHGPVIAYAICPDEQRVVVHVHDASHDGRDVLLPLSAGFPPPIMMATIDAGPKACQLLTDDPDALGEWAASETLAHRGLLGDGQWVGGVFYPKDRARVGSEQGKDALAVVMGFALATVLTRDRASALAEQLSQSSQQLYAAQQSLTEARALAVVGEMAAGAAHEMNNPLAVVVGRAQLMAESAADADRKTWQTVAEQAEKISDIVTEMMDFARPATPKPATLAVRDLLKRAQDRFAREPEGPQLQIRLRVADELPPVTVDADQLARALCELLHNALAAQEGSASVTLEADFDAVAEQVLLRVRDAGLGMDEPTLRQAFTPFFSAKPAGRARGMGLSKARRLIELNGGRIWLQSAPREGTTAFVLLPPAAETPATDAAEDVQ